MASLTRDQILARRAELPRLEVEVEELGGSVFVRVLTLKEVGEIQRAMKADPNQPIKGYPRVIALGCVNGDGSPMFVGEDVGLIDSLPFPAMEKIASEILYLNKMAERPKKDEDGDATGPKA